MSQIMTHQQWMSLTNGGRTSIRSSRLKAVDKALEKYSQTKSDADKEATTKALLLWIQFGEPGWQSQVEAAVKQHLPPLKEQARRVVQEHRFHIPSLANHQGLLKVNTKKLAEMMERKGQTGMVGFGSASL